MKETIVLLIIAVFLLALPHTAATCPAAVAVETTGDNEVGLCTGNSAEKIIDQEVFPFKSCEAVTDPVKSSLHGWNLSAAVFGGRHFGRFLISLLHFFRI